MPTVLEGVLEGHDGPEPRVRTSDVRAVLQRVVRTGDESGKSVALIAERADVSTRTVYRVLQPDSSKPTISLKLADALVLAAGAHPASTCTLVWNEGREDEYETPYLF